MLYFVNSNRVFYSEMKNNLIQDIMTRENLIKETVKKISKLPDSRVKEVSDFTDFLISKIEDQILTEGIKKIISESKSFDFLNEEEDLYTVKDLKERYK